MSDEETTEEAAAEKKPADMNGFTILQILTWTNAEIAKCREKLEVEPSGRVLAYLQGKIPGCKFAIKSIREIFGLTDEQFDALEKPCDFGSLTMEQILGAEIDMEKLQDNELWGQFISAIESRTEKLKDFLLKQAKKSRELDEYQGEYQGMMYFEKVFGSIKDQVVFWKNSLFKKGDQGSASGESDTRDANDLTALPAPEQLQIEDDSEPLAEDYEDPGERLDDEDHEMDAGYAGDEPA